MFKACFADLNLTNWLLSLFILQKSLLVKFFKIYV